MDNAYKAILELRLKIEENKKLIQKQEEALLVMEEMMGLAGKVVTPQEAFGEHNENGFRKILRNRLIPVESLSSSSNTKKTFRQEVEDVVKLFGDQEFTVANVHDALDLNGYRVNGQQPRARIAIILNELDKSGYIRTTFKGAGNVPNRYKRTNKEAQVDLIGIV